MRDRMKLSRSSKVLLCSLAGILGLALGSCSGGGGSGGLQRPTTVTMVGTVDDGTSLSPIGHAICHFVQSDGTQGAEARADGSGVFRIQVSPGLQGFLHCTPPGFLQLVLSTFVSTVGRRAGETIPATGYEEVSPRTTVMATVIAQEQPVDPQARKDALFAALARGDPALTALVEAAVILFLPLQEAGLDVVFDASTADEGSAGGDSGGNSAGGDSGGNSADGGAEGAVGDGAEVSPIPNARCAFALQLQGDVFVPSVLSDLFTHGRVTRPDVQGIAGQVNQALAGRATAITTAFATLFPTGLGSPLQTVATGADARYFLPVPAGVPGFVRCTPPDRAQLVLATFVRARQAGEVLTEQDVTPATTVFSAHIATLLAADLPTTEDNYVADIAGLHVGVMQTNGDITGFTMENVANLRDVGVSWVAFAATSLYTTLWKRALNADYLSAVQGLIVQANVDPTPLAANPGVSPQQAEAVAATVNDAINAAAQQVGANPQMVVSTAHLDVRVQAQGSGTSLPGVTLALLETGSLLQCVNCPARTNQDGEATLTLVGVPRDRATAVTLSASLAGLQDTTVTTAIVTVAKVPVNITLPR